MSRELTFDAVRADLGRSRGQGELRSSCLKLTGRAYEVRGAAGGEARRGKSARATSVKKNRRFPLILIFLASASMVGGKVLPATSRSRVPGSDLGEGDLLLASHYGE